jgi:uncharacterized protein YjbI with pentapeptide repeats
MRQRLRVWGQEMLHHHVFTRFLQVSKVVMVAIMLVVALSWPAFAENYNKENLVGADFSNRDLTDASFTKANLRNSNFKNSNLRGVSFFGANLEAANLQGADLSYATLDTARLSEADLTNAVLEGAFAFNTSFEGAVIEGADFTDVLLRQDAQDKLCQIAAGVNPVTQRSTRDSLFCP